MEYRGQYATRETRFGRTRASSLRRPARQENLPTRAPTATGRKAFEELRELIAALVPESTATKSLDPTKVLEGEKKIATVWAAREREAPTPEAYEKSLAGRWRKLGCAAEGAPYVLHVLVLPLEHGLVLPLEHGSTLLQIEFDPPFPDQSDAAKALAAAL